MKAQSQMLEYVLLMLLVVGVIMVLMIFLSWWQASQLGVEKAKNQQDRALSLLKNFISSPYMTKENSMMDDGKLTALAMIPGSCQMLEKVYGSGWHAEVWLFDGQPWKSCNTNPSSDYRSCNRWSICPVREGVRGKISRVLPVNIYRRIGFVLPVTDATLPRTYIGLLNVTLYV